MPRLPPSVAVSSAPAEQRLAELEARLNSSPKTPDNSSLPPSKGQKANQPDRSERKGPRQGSLGRKGGGRPLACDPDETVTAKALVCAHCQASLDDTNQVLHGRYNKIDLPPVRPVVTRVERYAGHCPCCGGVTFVIGVVPWKRCTRFSGVGSRVTRSGGCRIDGATKGDDLLRARRGGSRVPTRLQ